MLREMLGEWALGVQEGRTFQEPPAMPTSSPFGEEMDRRPPTYQTRETIKKYLWHKNSYRYNRLKRDFEWAQQCVEELGLNPEDARFLL